MGKTIAQVVRGVEVKKLKFNGKLARSLEEVSHIQAFGYNSLASAEVVVNREKVAEVVNNAIQSNKVIEIETAKPRISEVMLRTQLITAIATAIESGSIISLKEKND